MTAALRTLSEIGAMSAKAARGARCPWGLAEEAGLAVRLLEAHGLPGATELARLFATPRACICSGHAGAPACGLAEMAALSDAMPVGEARIGRVAAPVLLVAACLLDARHGGSWRVDLPGCTVQCGQDGVSVKGQPASGLADWVTVARSAPPAQSRAPSWRSREVPGAAWDALHKLASRTYLPETDASRASGAGPGEGKGEVE